jgi:high-affinity iron transporter
VSTGPQVWIGAAVGFLLCLIIGAAVIGTFYRVGNNIWESAEYWFQGTAYLLACLIISFTGGALLRLGKTREAWRLKVAKATGSMTVAETEAEGELTGKRRTFGRAARKYAVFLLSFITVFREGIEGVVFIAGVSFSTSASSVPLAVLVGLAAGCFIGWLLYK